MHKKIEIFYILEPMRDKIEVQDLFEASYLVCRGHQLSDLRVSRSRKRDIVHFIFEGPEVKGESAKFKMGHATANVCMLKVSMNHLKDLLFQRLREPEIGEQQHHVWTTKDR